MADQTGPCPSIKKPNETDKIDNRLADSTEADFSAEETTEEVA